MKKYSIILFAALLCGGCTNVRSIATINGVNLTKVTTRGVFSPSTSTIIASDPTKPGDVNVIVSASGPGVLPAVATAGGLVGAAAVLRPPHTDVNAVANGNGGSARSISDSHNTSTTTNSGFVPPGQVNNPGNGH